MIESLDSEQRQLLHAPFDSSDRREFTYLPGPRPGLALVDMTAEQQPLAVELLATGRARALGPPIRPRVIPWSR